jgi:hypothetical protein
MLFRCRFSIDNSPSRWTTLIIPPVGFVVTGISGCIKPKTELTNPDKELMKNESYKKGYEQKLRTRKWGKVLSGLGIALVVDAVVYTIVSPYIHRLAAIQL